jgi:hypothetical protein
MVVEPGYTAAMFMSTSKVGEQQPVVKVTSCFRRRGRRVELMAGAGTQATTAEHATHRKPT